MIHPLYIVIHLLNNWGLDYLSLQSCPVDCIPVAVPDPAHEIREEVGAVSLGLGPPGPSLDLPLCSLCC